MSAWAVQLQREDLQSIGALWHVPGIEALQTADAAWLRGTTSDEVTSRVLAGLSCVGRYDVLPSGELRPLGHRVPQGYLPTGTWQPLSKILNVSLPATSLASRRHSCVPVRLVPSNDTREPNVLVTHLDNWAKYSQSAPQVRLRHCQFAVATDGRAVIQGTPLPPLNGIRAVASSGLAVQCGWTWSPSVDASLLAAAWGVAPGDLWIFSPDQPIERLRADQFVAASRSAVQHTREAFDRGTD